MIVAEKTHCGIEVCEGSSLRDSAAYRSRSIVSQQVDGLHLITNGFRASSFAVSQKTCWSQTLRARLVPEPAFSDPSPAPQLRQNRIKRASLQAHQYGATTTSGPGYQ
jgi:hypothetical protein